MKPTKPGPQELGSVITYQRRYALGAILCLNIDEDDDGNKASEPPKEKKPAIMPDARFADMMKGLTKDNAGEWITKARKSFIFSEDQENLIRQWEENIISEIV